MIWKLLLEAHVKDVFSVQKWRSFRSGMESSKEYSGDAAALLALLGVPGVLVHDRLGSCGRPGVAYSQSMSIGVPVWTSLGGALRCQTGMTYMQRGQNT